MNKILIICLIFIGVMTRLIPHPPNFTPILSIALLSGFYFKNRLSILLPISIMLISDIFIGKHITMGWVYVSILSIYLLGYYLLKSRSLKNILLGSVVSSLIFFIVTNFGVWLAGYPLNFAGFSACYIAAIPFYKYTLLSVLMYSTLIHGGYLFISKKYLSYQDNN